WVSGSRHERRRLPGSGSRARPALDLVSMWEQEQTDSKQGVLERVMARLRDDLIKVGLDTVPPAAVPALSAGLGLVVAAVLWAISGAVVPSLAIGIGASVLPVLVLRSAARRRTTAMREVWPEAVDHVN